MDKSPEEILKQAAQAAERLLPGLNQRRVGLLAELQEIDRQITNLRLVAATNTSITPATGGMQINAPPPLALISQNLNKAESLVVSIMKSVGEPIGSEAIRRMLSAQGIEYGRSTVANTMTDLKRKGIATNDSEDGWTLIEVKQ